MAILFHARSVQNKACVVFDSQEQDPLLNVADHSLVTRWPLFNTAGFSRSGMSYQQEDYERFLRKHGNISCLKQTSKQTNKKSRRNLLTDFSHWISLGQRCESTSARTLVSTLQVFKWSDCLCFFTKPPNLVLYSDIWFKICSCDPLELREKMMVLSTGLTII